MSTGLLGHTAPAFAEQRQIIVFGRTTTRNWVCSIGTSTVCPPNVAVVRAATRRTSLKDGRRLMRALASAAEEPMSSSDGAPGDRSASEQNSARQRGSAA